MCASHPGSHVDPRTTSATVADRRRPRGVLLINLGTPDDTDVSSVRKYLAEFLSDPAVIQLPRGLGWLSGPLGRTIARFRAPASAEMYRRFWREDGSPLLTITRDQSRALEAVLPSGWRVFYAMRYGSPSIADVLREMESAGIEELVVVPMYPQFSGPTTGTALRELFGHLRQTGCGLDVSTRNLWYDDGGYIHAQAKLIHEFAADSSLTPDNTFLLFSAHGLPVSYARRGDPYPRHVKRTIDLVVKHLGWPEARTGMAYQSRFGPAEWLAPATNDVMKERIEKGDKHILVCPISFTVDCLETLEELGMRYRAEAESVGGKIHLCPALNTYKPFIKSLRSLVLNGPSPITSWSEQARPLMAKRRSRAQHNDVASLVVIGASIENRIGSGRGPSIAYTDPDGLRKIKRAHGDVPELLRTMREFTGLREAFLWNTCNRLEFYGWLDEGSGDTHRAHVAEAAKRCLRDTDQGEATKINALFGLDAWHHLIRTAGGLNSQLPGERDVVEQLDSAFRLAACAGTAGALTERLLADVKQLIDSVRADTDWGYFDPDYCYASLARVVPQAKLDLADSRIAVIGGSTTSVGVLRALIGRFEVPSRQLTLIYRGHKRGGNVKRLRKAIGNGRRFRVQSYAEAQVAKAVLEADVIIFGIDSDKPVLDVDQIRGRRDFEARPLTLIDFNTFGSTTGMAALDGVRLFAAAELESEVQAFADEMCASERFGRAVEAVEAWIADHARLGSTSHEGAEDLCEMEPMFVDSNSVAGERRSATRLTEAATLEGGAS